MKIVAFNQRLYEGLRRALGVQGGFPALVEGSTQPGVQLFDLEREEYAFLKGDRVLEAVNGALSDATHLPAIRLFNPAGSDVMAIVDSIEVLTDIAQDVILFVGGDLTGSVVASTGVSRDSRIQGRNTAWQTSSSSNNLLPAGLPTLGQRNRQVRLAANATYRFDGPWIMLPTNLGNALPLAQSLNVVGFNVASTLIVSFKYRERRWEKAER